MLSFASIGAISYGVPLLAAAETQTAWDLWDQVHAQFAPIESALQNQSLEQGYIDFDASISMIDEATRHWPRPANPTEEDLLNHISLWMNVFRPFAQSFLTSGITPEQAQRDFADLKKKFPRRHSEQSPDSYKPPESSGTPIGRIRLNQVFSSRPPDPKGQKKK